MQKIIDSTHLDVICLTEIWARSTDRFILPMTFEALTVEPTGNRSRENAGIALAWIPDIEVEMVFK